jgi:hypothetical protein
MVEYFEAISTSRLEQIPHEVVGVIYPRGVVSVDDW